MRIVFLGHVARLSGAEIGLLRLIQAAPELESVVVLAEDGPLVGALEAVGARVEVLPLAEQARGLRRAEIEPGTAQLRASTHVAGYVWKLRRRLRELQPDLVHTNSLKAGVYGTVAARLAGRPVLWHLHDRIAEDYLPPAIVRPLRAMLLTVPDAVVVPSRATLATVGRPRPRGPLVGVLPFPIPYPEQPLEVRDVVKRVGIVGRLTSWKGQDIFLRAFAQAFPDGPVEAVVIGSAMFGEHAFAAELEVLAADLGIADRVTFTGFREDVGEELAALDVLVHASVLADPLTTVVLEGMAAGLPVVSADAGGHAEHVVDGVNGFLHRPGDVADLARALRQAAGPRALREAVAGAGRETARQFSAGVAAPRMVDFYRRVLERHG